LWCRVGGCGILFAVVLQSSYSLERGHGCWWVVRRDIVTRGLPARCCWRWGRGLLRGSPLALAWLIPYIGRRTCRGYWVVRCDLVTLGVSVRRCWCSGRGVLRDSPFALVWLTPYGLKMYRGYRIVRRCPYWTRPGSGRCCVSPFRPCAVAAAFSRRCGCIPLVSFSWLLSRLPVRPTRLS
jgi:hypothetical protein